MPDASITPPKSSWALLAGIIDRPSATLTEILTAPAKTGDRRALQDYELYLTRFPNLSIMPLDVALARETALVRGETGLRTPAAIQVGAARLAGADATFCVTSDRRWVGRVVAPCSTVHPSWRKIAILPENLRRPDETWKVRLIEEEFMRLMFDVRDV
jgi:hypothetical protein